MWEQTLVTTADVPAEGLWEVIAAVEDWPLWDAEVESAWVVGEIGSRAVVVVKPREGSPVRLRIEEFSPPRRFGYVVGLPLARLRTLLEFEPVDAGTRIRATT